MAKRGNPGYGKSAQLKENVDKFAPLFWQLMEEMANSSKKEDKKFFITEFNKIQTKMVPQDVNADLSGELKVSWT